MVAGLAVSALRCTSALALLSLTLGCAHVAPTQPLRLVGQQTQWIAQTDQGPVVVQRSLTPYSVAKGALQPLVPLPGVQPVTEIEVLQALNDPGTMLIDMRDEEGPPLPTIPNAFHIPYSEVEDRLDELGCVRVDKSRWDCNRAVKVITFCFGPMCVQSPAGIKRMVQAGFPVDKIAYYRGGMMAWQALGLTTVTVYRTPRQ